MNKELRDRIEEPLNALIDYVGGTDATQYTKKDALDALYKLVVESQLKELIELVENTKKISYEDYLIKRISGLQSQLSSIDPHMKVLNDFGKKKFGRGN